MKSEYEAIICVTAVICCIIAICLYLTKHRRSRRRKLVLDGQIAIENVRIPSPWNLTKPKPSQTPDGVDHRTAGELEMTPMEIPRSPKRKKKRKKKKKRKRKPYTTPGYITPSISYPFFQPHPPPHHLHQFSVSVPLQHPHPRYPPPARDHRPKNMSEPVYYPNPKDRRHHRHQSETTSVSTTSSTGTFITTTTMDTKATNQSSVRPRLNRSRSGVFKAEESHLYDVDELAKLEREMSSVLAEHKEMERRASQKFSPIHAEKIANITPQHSDESSNSSDAGGSHHRHRRANEKRKPEVQNMAFLDAPIRPGLYLDSASIERLLLKTSPRSTVSCIYASD